MLCAPSLSESSSSDIYLKSATAALAGVWEARSPALLQRGERGEPVPSAAARGTSGRLGVLMDGAAAAAPALDRLAPALAVALVAGDAVLVAFGER